MTLSFCSYCLVMMDTSIFLSAMEVSAQVPRTCMYLSHIIVKNFYCAHMETGWFIIDPYNHLLAFKNIKSQLTLWHKRILLTWSCILVLY